MVKKIRYISDKQSASLYDCNINFVCTLNTICHKPPVVKLIGPESFYSKSKRLAIQDISSRSQKEHKRWRSIPGFRISKLSLLPSLSTLYLYTLLLDRGNIRKVVEFTTEQGHLRKHVLKVYIFSGNYCAGNVVYKRKLQRTWSLDVNACT